MTILCRQIRPKPRPVSFSIIFEVNSSRRRLSSRSSRIFHFPHDRLCLLFLRAEILWARGERAEALAVAGYLLSCGDSNRQLVEETPFGLVFSPLVSPTQAWARYLSARAADALKSNAGPARDPLGDAIDPHPQDAIGIPDMPFLEKGALRSTAALCE